jgi:hypothetical protein
MRKMSAKGDEGDIEIIIPYMLYRKVLKHTRFPEAWIAEAVQVYLNLLAREAG